MTSPARTPGAAAEPGTTCTTASSSASELSPARISARPPPCGPSSARPLAGPRSRASTTMTRRRDDASCVARRAATAEPSMASLAGLIMSVRGPPPRMLKPRLAARSAYASASGRSPRPPALALAAASRRGLRRPSRPSAAAAGFRRRPSPRAPALPAAGRLRECRPPRSSAPPAGRQPSTGTPNAASTSSADHSRRSTASSASAPPTASSVPTNPAATSVNSKLSRREVVLRRRGFRARSVRGLRRRVGKRLGLRRDGRRRRPLVHHRQLHDLHAARRDRGVRLELGEPGAQRQTPLGRRARAPQLVEALASRVDRLAHRLLRARLAIGAVLLRQRRRESPCRRRSSHPSP